MADLRVYLLHGWSVSSENEAKWAHFRGELAKGGIKSEFLNIPGLSSPLTEVWKLDDFVEWLAGELPSKPVMLLGHSFGGQIAIRFAAKYPERVSHLILIDSAGIRDHAVWPTLKRKVFWLGAKLGRVFFQSQTARKALYFFARERNYYNAPPLLRRTMSNVLDEEVLEDLPLVQAPTLLIWGANDAVTPLKLGKQMEALLPKARLEVVQQARHSPHFTHPKVVSKLVQAAADSSHKSLGVLA